MRTEAAGNQTKMWSQSGVRLCDTSVLSMDPGLQELRLKPAEASHPHSMKTKLNANHNHYQASNNWELSVDQNWVWQEIISALIGLRWEDISSRPSWATQQLTHHSPPHTHTQKYNLLSTNREQKKIFIELDWHFHNVNEIFIIYRTNWNYKQWININLKWETWVPICIKMRKIR